jgi:hypothetical protein
MSYAGKPYPPPGTYAAPQEATNPLGVVSLVLGIMSIFMGCPAAIGALITGWMAMKREPSGMARAGFFIGLIMTIFHVVAGIVGVIIFVCIIGFAAYADSQQRATPNYSSYPGSSYSESSGFDSSYGSPDIAPMPVAMPPMEMPKMPDPYVPPPMAPGMDPTAFPGAPDFGAPPSFSPPSGMGRGPGFPSGAFGPRAFPSGPGAYPGAFPPGAFPPGLGPPTTMETLSPTSEDSEADLTP